MSTLEQQIFALTKTPDKLLQYCLGQLEKNKHDLAFQDSLSYLTQNELTVLLQKAFEILNQPKKSFFSLKFKENKIPEPIETLVCHISYQYPTLLHPYVKDIWRFKINQSTYNAYKAWRGLNETDIDYFKDLFIHSNDKNERYELYRTLIETCHLDTLQWLYDHCQNNLGYIDSHSLDIKTYTNYHFEEVGFVMENEWVQLMEQIPVYHLVFPANHIMTFDDKNPFLTQHPTYFGDDNDLICEFGGILQYDENNPLCKIIEFNPIPHEFNIKNLPKLTLACHLAECGYENLFYQHNEQGMPTRIGVPDDEIDCMDKADSVFLPCQVKLHKSDERWHLQDWAVANARQNLNRIGGLPSWIQSADIPICPITGQKMRFLMQLDSNIKSIGGSEVYFGSGGICYVFWCDDSRVSAFLMQCT